MLYTEFKDDERDIGVAVGVVVLVLIGRKVYHHLGHCEPADRARHP